MGGPESLVAVRRSGSHFSFFRTWISFFVENPGIPCRSRTNSLPLFRSRGPLPPRPLNPLKGFKGSGEGREGCRLWGAPLSPPRKGDRAKTGASTWGICTLVQIKKKRRLLFQARQSGLGLGCKQMRCSNGATFLPRSLWTPPRNLWRPLLHQPEANFWHGNLSTDFGQSG